MLYEVGGVVEFALVVLLVSHGHRSVTAKRQNMIYTRFFQGGTVSFKVVSGESDAGNVCDGIDL